jgi:hypothetical protein
MFGKKVPEQPKPPERQLTGPLPKSPGLTTPSLSTSPSPPLFVKVEKYNDIVQNLQKLQSQTAGLKKTLDTLTEVEHRLHRSLEASYRTLDGLTTVISLIMGKLSQKSPIHSPEMKKSDNMIDGYFKGVSRELDKIKSELEHSV